MSIRCRTPRSPGCSYHRSSACFVHPHQQHTHCPAYRESGQGNLRDIHHRLDRDAIWPDDDDGDWPPTGAAATANAACGAVSWRCLGLRCPPYGFRGVVGDPKPNPEPKPPPAAISLAVMTVQLPLVTGSLYTASDRAAA